MLLYRRIPSELFFLGRILEEQEATGWGWFKSAREKKKLPVKILKFLPVKPLFLPVKKTEKVPVKTKSAREKTEKTRKTRA